MLWLFTSRSGSTAAWTDAHTSGAAAAPAVTAPNSAPAPASSSGAAPMALSVPPTAPTSAADECITAEAASAPPDKPIALQGSGACSSAPRAASSETRAEGSGACSSAHPEVPTADPEARAAALTFADNAPVTATTTGGPTVTGLNSSCNTAGDPETEEAGGDSTAAGAGRGGSVSAAAVTLRAASSSGTPPPPSPSSLGPPSRLPPSSPLLPSLGLATGSASASPSTAPWGGCDSSGGGATSPSSAAGTRTPSRAGAWDASSS